MKVLCESHRSLGLVIEVKSCGLANSTEQSWLVIAYLGALLSTIRTVDL